MGNDQEVQDRHVWFMFMFESQFFIFFLLPSLSPVSSFSLSGKYTDDRLCPTYSTRKEKQAEIKNEIERDAGEIEPTERDCPSGSSAGDAFRRPYFGRCLSRSLLARLFLS